MESWHRFYDPDTGRYVSADPIGLWGGINLYTYVGGDPTDFSDPEGLCGFGDCIIPGVVIWGFGTAISIYHSQMDSNQSDRIPNTEKPPENCDNKCQPKYDRIKVLTRLVKRAYLDQSYDRKGIPLTGGGKKGSLIGHQESFDNYQRALRAAIQDALANNCPNYDKDADRWAQAESPVPGRYMRGERPMKEWLDAIHDWLVKRGR